MKFIYKRELVKIANKYAVRTTYFSIFEVFDDFCNRGYRWTRASEWFLDCLTEDLTKATISLGIAIPIKQHTMEK